MRGASDFTARLFASQSSKSTFELARQRLDAFVTFLSSRREFIAINATKSAGVDNAAQVELLRSLTRAITELQGAAGRLEEALGHHAGGDAYAHARQARDEVLPAMAQLRQAGDKLETMVADEYWPLPTYREMLFIK